MIATRPANPETPLQKAWREVKAANPGTLILMMSGEVCETFREDAFNLFRVLELRPPCRLESPAIGKLVSAGHKVRIAALRRGVYQVIASHDPCRIRLRPLAVQECPEVCPRSPESGRFAPRRHHMVTVPKTSRKIASGEYRALERCSLCGASRTFDFLYQL